MEEVADALRESLHEGGDDLGHVLDQLNDDLGQFLDERNEEFHARLDDLWDVAEEPIDDGVHELGQLAHEHLDDLR